VVSQRNILRRHAALIEKLFAANPDNHVIRLNPSLEDRVGKGSSISLRKE
jgi:hypothetical protein